jgi:hypothetical protein
MNSIRGLWMIRALNARSGGSPFLDDVAHGRAKIAPTLGLVKMVRPYLNFNLSAHWLGLARLQRLFKLQFECTFACCLTIMQFFIVKSITSPSAA